MEIKVVKRKCKTQGYTTNMKQ